MREIVMVTTLDIVESFDVTEETAEETLKEYQELKYKEQELAEYITALGADDAMIIKREAWLV